ncbi:ScbA/BarX family gamma-butyrolactone biosynthesis protein [Streptomyces sp. TP-A0874]|uniref:ScbA/BarX family gamma-butyrolactone biosynthesis protein n=1 Tax=Streptomyces sp. TP-A0874 TaxID=549819 RepID=UPI000A618E84|nr:ScbA/BarX family gamma-butyrolactone biosynthesis protein [Streptomyces sp. TP-A0874]
MPRELVHRVSVAEVLLTDVRSLGDGNFEAAGQWTRSHPTFPRGRGDRHHPLIILETLRQLGIYIPLRYYPVDPQAHFLIKNMSFAADPVAEPRVVDGATEVTCLVSVSEVRTDRSGALTGMRMCSRYLTGGRVFAIAEGSARIVDSARYAALRGTAALQLSDTAGASSRDPVDALTRPAPTGLDLASPLDVMLQQGREDRLALLVSPADMRHPFFFDHASDHVPGMALLEAARQAAALRTQGALLRPVSGRLRAQRFTELTPPAQVECVFRNRVCVFKLRQGGTATAAGVFRYS